jgi:hypothetical protein
MPTITATKYVDIIGDSWKYTTLLGLLTFSSTTGIFDKATISEGTSSVILNTACREGRKAIRH